MSTRSVQLRVLRGVAVVAGVLAAAIAAFAVTVMSIDIQDEDATLEEKS